MKVILSSLCACWTPAVLRFSRIIWGKVCFSAVASAGFRHTVNQFIVFIHPEHAVRREALDGERPGHADLLLVVVGLVVEVFKLGLGGDGGIDLLLAGNAGLPPVGVQFLRRVRPLGLGLAWNLPLLPGLLERGVQRLAQWFQLRLPLLPDDIDLRVVGDGLQGDVRNALIDEAVADVAVDGLLMARCG